jgi:hypothetical protein
MDCERAYASAGKYSTILTMLLSSPVPATVRLCGVAGFFMSDTSCKNMHQVYGLAK